MAVTYSNAAKEDRMEAIGALVSTSGKLKIYTTGLGTLLSTHVLQTTGESFTNGVWTLDFVADTVAASGTGTADDAIITTSGDVTVISGLTVGTGSEDIVLDNDSITSGQNVTLTSATITHAA